MAPGGRATIKTQTRFQITCKNPLLGRSANFTNRVSSGFQLLAKGGRNKLEVRLLDHRHAGAGLACHRQGINTMNLQQFTDPSVSE